MVWKFCGNAMFSQSFLRFHKVSAQEIRGNDGVLCSVSCYLLYLFSFNFKMTQCTNLPSLHRGQKLEKGRTLSDIYDGAFFWK